MNPSPSYYYSQKQSVLKPVPILPPMAAYMPSGDPICACMFVLTLLCKQVVEAFALVHAIVGSAVT